MTPTESHNINLTDEQKRSIVARDPRYAKLFGITLDTKTTSHSDTTIRPRSNLTGYCIYLGPDTEERVSCPTCRGSVSLKILECGRYGRCTIEKKVTGIACCSGCSSYTPKPTP